MTEDLEDNPLDKTLDKPLDNILDTLNSSNEEADSVNVSNKEKTTRQQAKAPSEDEHILETDILTLTDDDKFA